MAMQLTRYEYDALRDTHKADTATQRWVLKHGLATREIEVEHDQDCAKEVWMLTEAGKAAVAEFEAAQRYPLWCVDSGGYRAEDRYRGPWPDKESALACALDEWHEEDGDPEPTLRRCRRMLLSDVLRRSASRMIPEPPARQLDDNAAHEPENGKAWAHWDDSVLDTLEGFEDAMIAVLDRFVQTSVYVCEGDEAFCVKGLPRGAELASRALEQALRAEVFNATQDAIAAHRERDEARAEVERLRGAIRAARIDLDHLISRNDDDRASVAEAISADVELRNALTLPEVRR